MLLMVVCQLAFPLLMAPAFLPPLIGMLWQRFGGGPPAAIVNLLLSMLLAAISVFVYWRTLEPLGRLLHRRETKIIGIVTVEVE
jgi:Kef-type K+ transport system membrane component KefB